METQGFMPDMQPLNPGRVQQSSPAPQQQQQQSTPQQAAQPQNQPQSQPSVSATQTVSQAQSSQQQQSQITRQSRSSPTQSSPASSQQSNPSVSSSSQQVQSSQASQQAPQTTVVQVSTSNGTPQFIAVTVSEQEGQGQSVTLQPAPGVHPTYVQYVDGPGDPSLYAATNGQMTGYPVYNVTDSNAMYSPASGTYYNTASGTAVTYSQVQWLIDNYETAEGVSLPRSTLYNHYLRHCAEHKLEPVNAASFGKLIRSVFLGLRTRRLGTRGNSKYHYYGIRVKPNSPLNQLQEEVPTTALRQQSVTQTKRYRLNTPNKSENHEGCSQSTNSQTPDSSSGTSQTQQPQSQHQQYLGDASAAIPAFGDIEISFSSLPDGITETHIHNFKMLYREHCENFLDAVINLQFSAVETLWQNLWRTPGNDCLDQEEILPKSRLYLLCQCEPVQQFVQKADYQFYQNLVDVLIPDVLRPIPSSLTQAIRNFAKSLEGWLTSAMVGCPEEIINVKVGAVSAFAQTLRRYTSLNHLAQAARAVLQNTSQINQMLADLNRVDFHNVQEQASWVCQCEDGLVQKLEQGFKVTLQQQTSLEQWAAWLEDVVNVVLKPFEGKPDFPKAARQFLLKWSFYSSMVIRDLTLRSAASFGSFHLIRLLYDEYMFYLIEHKVAEATGKTSIAVMGEFIGLGSKTSCGSRDLSSPSQRSPGATSSIMENGSSNEGSCTSTSRGSYSIVLTNGLKDVTTLPSVWPSGLIGQPQVASESEGMSSTTVLPPNKKLKAV